MKWYIFNAVAAFVFLFLGFFVWVEILDFDSPIWLQVFVAILGAGALLRFGGSPVLFDSGRSALLFVRSLPSRSGPATWLWLTASLFLFLLHLKALANTNSFLFAYLMMGTLILALIALFNEARLSLKSEREAKRTAKTLSEKELLIMSMIERYGDRTEYCPDGSIIFVVYEDDEGWKYGRMLTADGRDVDYKCSPTSY